MDHNMGCSSFSESYHNPKQRQSPIDRIRDALAILRAGKISLLDFLTKILDPSEDEFKAYRMATYTIPKDGPPKKLYNFFDLILSDPRGGPIEKDCQWIDAQAVEIVTTKIYNEMDKVKDALQGTIDSITSDFLTTWCLNSTMDRILDENAPTLNRVLESASRTNRAHRKNMKKTSTTV
jgi:hypothetical protein